MFRFAVKSTFAKKMRLLSTALSVMLGIAFLAGTLVFTDTIKRTFDDLFADIYESTDTYVRSATSVDLGLEGGTQRGRIDEAILDDVRAVDGVADAQPVVQGYMQLVDANGDAIGNPGQGPPTFGMNYIGGVLGTYELVDGSREPGPDEVVVDVASFDESGHDVGDEVTVLTQTGPHQMTLVGSARFGSVDSPGGASVALFDLGTAQDVLVGGRGEIDAVMIAATPGVGEDELTEAVAAVLPDSAEAITGTAITEEVQGEIQDALGFFNTFLLVFAAIGLVVACFTIYNTFQIIVTQRAREMALLRAVGASRRQVLSAQLLEALFVGLVASVIGLFAGVLVADLLKGMLGAFGIDIPASGTVFRNRTAIVAVVVGVVTTVVAAVFPSLRASRVAPIAALRDVAVEYSDRPVRRLFMGGTPLVFGVGLLVAGLALPEIWFVGLGVLAMLVGVFVLGPLLARPIVGVVGAPLPSARGIVGEIAVENAVRNPKRTSRTGGALMVSVALVAAITIIAASARDWTRDVFGDQFTGDLVVSTNTSGFGGLSPQLAADLNELPEVDAATGVRVGAAHIVTRAQSADTSYVAVDPETVGKVFDIGMIEGAIDALTVNGVLVDDGEAASQALAVGDAVAFTFLNGSTKTLTVEGIYTADELAGDFVVAHALHERSGSDQFDFSVYISTASGVSEGDARAAVEALAEPYAQAEVQTKGEYIDAQAAQVDQLLNLMYGLLALAVIIALFSIANSMALSIYERTREIGLMRAVGMTRRQTRSSVRWESVLISILGSGLGLFIGVFFGWAISVVLRDEGFGAVTLPYTSLIVIVALAILGGLIAAIRPARRAARLDVLQAIATQ